MLMEKMNLELTHNYNQILHKIKIASEEVGRNPNDIEIVAVCKRQPTDKVIDAIKLGIKNFGENRYQDAVSRWDKIKKHREQIKLSFVGSLQSNKCNEVLNFFDKLETIDRDKIAKISSQSLNKKDKKIEFSIQVNTGEEKQKSGIIPQEANDFILKCRRDYGLNISGLMCIPPEKDNSAIHFALLQKIAKKNNIKNLSMGMSNDYEKAILFGATHIRIGTGLFGKRLDHESFHK